MMAKPSLESVLGEQDEEDLGGDDAAPYIDDIKSAFGVDDKAAQKIYDVMCAIARDEGSTDEDGGSEMMKPHKKPGIAIVLGR